MTSARDLKRLGAATAAASLIAFSMTRRSAGGMSMGLAALPLAYRALMGDWPAPFGSAGLAPHADTRYALAGDRGIHVREAVRVERPLADVYQFCRQPDNLAKLFATPEAEIINEVEHQVIGWRSTPNAAIVSAGSINFDAVRCGRGTQISVHLQYAPPAGRIGALAAMAVGRAPSQTIREELRRLKQLLEAGETPQAALHSHGESAS
jgi:uncharacterized membrane protein